jgi:predicted amidohydrolase
MMSGSPTPDALNSDRLRVACVQLQVRGDKGENIDRAGVLVAEAADRGADVVVLPEKWNAYGEAPALRASAESIDGGKTVEAMRRWARGNGIVLVGGSITEHRVAGKRLSNTCVVFDRDGSLGAVYRKIHMFDVDVGGLAYRESDLEEPGDEIVLVDAGGWTLGLSVCYDLRFPELFRTLALAGAELVTIPAAFTSFTGKDHWEVLLRARAIENQCYVAAAAQWGMDPAGRPTFGRSMIIDPWGIVLATAPDEDDVVVCDIDRRRLQQIRRDLPSLANRQPNAYRVAEASGNRVAT